jgi:hypothetical protein
MAEQKILISIKINDREAANTQKQLKVTKDNFHSLTDAEKKKIIADKQLALSAKAVDKSLTQQAAAANAAAAATDKMRATSGLNNAIIMESSRLASDASFGFTAIANNLSQLVNLFQMNVKATGSFTSAISGLFTAQAAVLIGIQLLITYGDRLAKAIMDAANSSSILNDTFKDLGGEVSSSAGNFETYIKILQDSNRSQEQQNIAVEKLKEEFPEYITQLDEAGVSLQDVAKNTKEAKKQNDNYRDSLIQLGMSRAAQTKIEELSAERLNLVEERRKYLRAQGIVDEEDAKKEINRINEQYGDEFIEYDKEYKKIIDTTDRVTQQALLRRLEQSNIGKLKSRRDFLAAQKGFNEEEIKELDEQIKQFSEYRILSNKNEEEEAKKRNRIFKAADLDFEKETQKSRERLLKGFIKDEKLQIKIKFDGIRERARLKRTEFEQDQQRRLDEFLAVEEDENKRLDAQKRFDNEVAKSKESLTKYINQLNAEQLVATGNLTIEQSQKIIDADRELQYKLQENDQRAADQEVLNEGIKSGRLFDLKNQQLEKERVRLETQLENEKLTFQDRMSLQDQLTDVEQQQTDARIKMAELEAKSKMQLLDVTANALSSFSKLAGKETVAGKALAVASTLMSTYSAGQKAYESQFLPIPTTSSPIRGTIAKIAAYASGFASVKEILKVKTPAGSGSTSSGAAAASRTIQAPDFNVVGASQTSQLAQTVAGEQAKPVKAFVVGKDISTQQELDRNITNTASFG